MIDAPVTHDLFLYDDDSDFADRMPQFVEEGVEAGEVVVAVLLSANRDLMREEIGPSVAERVTFIACEDHYTRPEAALAGYDAAVRQYLREGAPAVRLCGELPNFDYTTEEEWTQWVGYEAILNRAFAGRPVSIMCVYDERRLPESVIDGARRAHPRLLTDHSVEGNVDYVDPSQLLRETIPAGEPLPGLDKVPLESGSKSFRERLARELDAAGISTDRIERMLVAAGEVYANSWQHGSGPRTLRAGRVGDSFVCELSDRGRGLDDPLAGFLPPKPGNAAGGGLWVARQLTRRLDLLPAPGGGLSARLWV